MVNYLSIDQRIEKFLQVHIDVAPKTSETQNLSHDLPFVFSESKTSLLLTVDREFTSMHADIYIDNQFITSVRIGKKGQIKIPKRSETARSIIQTASSQKDIHLFLKDF